MPTPFASRDRARAFCAHAVPYLLALFFAIWALRGVTHADMTDRDAPRHAMNGALVHDFIRDGPFTDPLAYGRAYYTRLPATSLPYHPPLFPMLESLFYFVLGVNVSAARLAVAAAVGAAVLLMYRLVAATHSSQALAFAVTLTFFSWRWSQWLAADVMLEFPALALILASLFFIRRMDIDYPMRRGLAFALLAGGAVWTKQQAVFLGLVPFACVLLSRRFRLFRQKTIWVSSVVFGAVVLGLIALSLPLRGTGVNEVPSTARMTYAFAHHSRFYAKTLFAEFGLLALAVPALALYFLIVPRLRKRGLSETDVYLAWSACAFLLLTAIRPFDERYLFFVVPPLVLMLYDAARLSARRIAGPTAASAVLVAIASAVFAANLRTPRLYLDGPRDAAAAVLANSPRRILYCGPRTDGNFIFAIRSMDPDRRVIILRGDKLPPPTFARDAFEKFANRYGIESIVLEEIPMPAPWDPLPRAPAPSMILQKEVRLASSDAAANGVLRIYRFTNPSPDPERVITVPVSRIGAEVQGRF